MLIFGGEHSLALAKKIAAHKKAKCYSLDLKKFPDGELYIRFPVEVRGEEVVIVQSMQPQPNDGLLHAYFACETAKDLGAKKITVVAPYIAYMRQDARFNPGECVTNVIVGKMFNTVKFLTIDAHLHRTREITKLFGPGAQHLTSNSVVAQYIKKNFKNAVILGPDWESFQWAEKIAKMIHLPVTVLEKKRFSSRKVEVKMKIPIDFKGKNVVIVDDIISTGNTMIKACKLVKSLGAKSVHAIGVHGLFAEGALDKMKRNGFSSIVSTNTTENPVAKIDVSGVIAEKL